MSFLKTGDLDSVSWPVPNLQLSITDGQTNKQTWCNA